MARSFNELRAQMSTERRARNMEKAGEILQQLPLYKLREAVKLSQTQLAEAMEINQSAVSKIESRTDLYISTVRRYIEAIGGTLSIRAQFPEGNVEIDLFGQIDNDLSDNQGEAELL